MRILEHIENREIGSDITGRERGERDRDKGKLRERQWLRGSCENGIAKTRTNHRDEPLNQRKEERQNQRVMPDLGDHRGFPCSGSDFLP